MIVMDGFNKASARTIEWLRSIFPGEPWAILDHLTPTKTESPQTIQWFKKNAQRFRHSLKMEGGITDDKTWAAKNSDPLKEYAVIFQSRDPKNQFNLYPTTITPPLPKENIKTYFTEVFERESHCTCNPCDFESVAPMVNFEMPVTLIVKVRNRQKHDSHWWSLCPNGFIDSYPDSRFCFFTDCGTLFDEECLYFMLREMERDDHKKIGAVTGRQRVMNAKQQEATGEGIVSEFLRHVQRCDFELSFATSVGAFALAGCLPVLPGPCGLYRRETIISGAGEFYHAFLSMEVDNIGLTEANVMIAEDRVLSISPFFSKYVKDSSSTDELVNYPGMQTQIAPHATFYYEAETSIMSLVKQRRRWINGTIAAYLWLLFKKPSLIWNSFNISIWRKLLIYFLIFVQAYQFLFVFISPSIFLILFRTALIELNWKETLYSDYWFMILMVLYLLFVWASSYGHARDWMFYIGILVGIFVELLAIAGITKSIVYQALRTQDDFYESINYTGSGPIPGYIGNFSWLDLIPFGLLGLVAILPIIGALFASPRSFMYVLRSGVYFLLFLPTLVGVFGIYSICNYSDFSWGNRDSNGSADKLGSRLGILIQRGAFFGWFFFALNLCLIFVSLDLFGNDIWRIVGSFAIFGLPLICIIMSCFYWIGWRIVTTFRQCKGLVSYPKITCLTPPTTEEKQVVALVNRTLGMNNTSH